jgi:hypothetical protein
VWHHCTELQGGQPRFDLVVADGPATGQMVKTLAIPGSILEMVPDSMLKRDARSIRTFLASPERTGIVIVALAEELPVVEALELVEAIRGRLGLSVAALVANAVYPVIRSAELLDEAATWQDVDPRLAFLLEESRIFLERRRINERHLILLRERGGAPLVTLPLLFGESVRSAEIDRLVQALEQADRRP